MRVNVLIIFVCSGGAAISYFGYAYVAQNPELIAVPIIDRGATVAVAPTATTIFDGSYVSEQEALDGDRSFRTTA